jgi:hypothetical protein
MVRISCIFDGVSRSVFDDSASMQGIEPDFDTIVSRVRSACNLGMEKNLKLTYEDDEGDLITVTNDIEMKDALDIVF